jgi:hypothetical protein
MKKLVIAIFASLFLSTVAFAGQIGVGVTGSFAAVTADGKEADQDGAADTSLRDAHASETAIVPSTFVEYSFDNGFTVGYDMTLGSANVNSKTITRTDDSAEAAQDGDRSAQAEIDNVTMFYAQLPLGGSGLYLKGGMVQMDVNTQDTDTVTTAGSYGNASIDGVQYGLGFRNTFGSNGFYKLEGTFTDMDAFTLKSSTTDKGNQITADLDVTKATLAIGFNF